MKPRPPKWADRFLQWYCRPDLLEEIQGDAYELYYRSVPSGKLKADIQFAWNVIRFFRWRNIRSRSLKHTTDNQISPAMIKNILIVAIRNFFRQPVHALLNVLGLVVGFTCAFLVLIWVMYEFSFDKFHSQSDTLYKVMTHVQADGKFQSYDVASAVLDASSVPEVDTIAPVSTGNRWPHVLCFRSDDKNNDCVYLNGVYSNSNLFSIFSFPVIAGNPTPLLEPNTIAISQNMARLVFNDKDPIGKTIKIDGWKEVVVSSVFKDIPVNSSIQFDFAMPFNVVQKLWGINDDQFAANFINVYLKTHSVVDAGVLTSKLNDTRVVTEALKAQNVSYEVLPLASWRLKDKYENGKPAGGRIEYVIIFIVIGALVTLMAVINFINLTTARATTRAKEIGIRKVTGAFRSTIMLQFVGESFLIVLIATIFAVGTTQLVLPLFQSVTGETINTNLFQGAIPIYVIAFLVVVSLLAGLYPAVILSSFKPVTILKGQSGGVTGSQRFRKMLLVAQLSISTGIVIFCGVLYLQLKYVTQKDLGFDRENMIRIEPTAKLFKNFEAFKNELSGHSSIAKVASSNLNPLNAGGGNTGVSWPGKPKDMRVSFTTLGCSYEFPETFGLKIIDGRNFESQPLDSLATEVLVTEDAVKAMGLQQPVGTTISIGDVPCLIIGVVNNFHTASLHQTRLPVILARTPYMQTSAIYVKYQPGTTAESLEAVTKVYKQFEPDFSMKYWFQDDAFNELYKTETVALRLILGFTMITLVIATLGVVGLATYNTLRKTKEIGVRRVMGASIPQVLMLLLNEFSMLLAVALIVAAPVAWYTSDQWLQGFAYRISVPWWIFVATFSATGLLIAGIVCAQGMKTVSANPVNVLRSE